MRKNGHREKTRNSGTLFLWGTFICLFIVSMLFYTWCRVQCVRVGYEISSETDRHRKLTVLQSELKIELARLKSPERISHIARTRLGLRTPGPEQTIVIP